MITGAIIFGFIILAVAYNHASDVRNELYKKEQEEWRRMEYELYHVNVPDTKSPYILKSTIHTKTQKWGFSVFDKNAKKFVMANGQYTIYYTMTAALAYMNQLEIIGGFDKTNLEILETTVTKDS